RGSAPRRGRRARGHRLRRRRAARGARDDEHADPLALSAPLLRQRRRRGGVGGAHHARRRRRERDPGELQELPRSDLSSAAPARLARAWIAYAESAPIAAPPSRSLGQWRPAYTRVKETSEAKRSAGT